MKIALVCSAGGHLTEIEQLQSIYKKYPHFFVTFKRQDTEDLQKSHNVFFVNDPKRSATKMVVNALQAWKILRKEKPQIILTTGAGMAIPFCILAKLLGSKIIYIESFCRVQNPSATGRVLYRFADLFLVQWENLKEKFGEKAQYWGQLV